MSAVAASGARDLGGTHFTHHYPNHLRTIHSSSKTTCSQRMPEARMGNHLLTGHQTTPLPSTNQDKAPVEVPPRPANERSFERVPVSPLITPAISVESKAPWCNPPRFTAPPPRPFVACPGSSRPRAPGLHLTLDNDSIYTQDPDHVSLLFFPGTMPAYPALELPVGNPISIIAMNQTLRRMQHELNEATNALRLTRAAQERCIDNETGLHLAGKRGNDAELNKVRQEVMRLEEVGRQLRDAMWGIRRTLEVAERESGDVLRRMNDAGEGHAISKDNDAGQVMAGGVGEEDADWEWDPEAF